MAEMTTATATMNPVDVDEIERGIAPPRRPALGHPG